MLKSCWNGNARERPAFASLAARVAELTDVTREVGDRDRKHWEGERGE